MLACSVCRGDLELGFADPGGDWPAPLPCGHVFHARSCLVPWLRHSPACPLCRATVASAGARSYGDGGTVMYAHVF